MIYSKYATGGHLRVGVSFRVRVARYYGEARYFITPAQFPKEAKNMFSVFRLPNMCRVTRTRHTENASETGVSTSTHDFTMALSRRKIPVSRNMFFVFRAAHTAGKTGRKTENMFFACHVCRPLVILYLYSSASPYNAHIRANMQG